MKTAIGTTRHIKCLIGVVLAITMCQIALFRLCYINETRLGMKSVGERELRDVDRTSSTGRIDQGNVIIAIYNTTSGNADDIYNTTSGKADVTRIHHTKLAGVLRTTQLAILRSTAITTTVTVNGTHKTKPVVSPFVWRFRVLPNEPCPPGDVIHLLCIVPTDPYKFKARMRVRATWGNTDEYKMFNMTVRVVFVMGVPKKINTNLVDILRAELETYRDIVIGDFVDDYYNLTTKMRVAFRYASTHCAQALFTMKIDDDVLVDIFLLMNYFSWSKILYWKNVIACHTLYEHKPIRLKTSKWYISEAQYPNSTYPPYCNGPMYVMSRGMTSLIDEHAAYVRPFPLEDMSFTGLVREAIGGITLHDIHSYTLLWQEGYVSRLPEWRLLRSIATHRIRDDLYDTIWNQKKYMAFKSSIMSPVGK